VSTIEQAKNGISLETQKMLINEFVKNKFNREVDHFFEDAGEKKASIVEDIEFYFDDKIISALNAITKLEGENFLYEYLPRVMQNKIALAVKIADSSHNLSRNKYITDESVQQRLRKKYVEGLSILGLTEKEINGLI
jgi:hypothetical protein